MLMATARVRSIFMAITAISLPSFVFNTAIAAKQPLLFTEQQLEQFEKKIRPLLVKRCHQCHSKIAKRLEGGLYLDSRAGAIKGGDTGPAIHPGDARNSLLVAAIRYNGDYKMPP